MSATSGPIFRAAFSALLLAGCGNGGHSKKPGDVAAAVESPFDDAKISSSKVASETPGREMAAGALRTSPAPAAPDPFEKIFDFASNLNRAHLRSGGLLIDFGTPARYKHTLGSWKSGWSGDFEEGDLTYSYMTDSVAHIFFDALEGESAPARITFRARGIGSKKARVYLNGEYAGSMELEAGQFGYATVEAKKGIIQGQNDLMVRANGRSDTARGTKAAIAVDYVRVAFDAEREGPAASSIDAVRSTGSSGGQPGILLNQGESVLYNLPIDKGMRLRLEARARMAGGKGRLEVAAVSDKGGRTILDNREVGSLTSKLDIGLDDFDDEVVSISFGVLNGEIVIGEAGLFQKPRELKKAPGELKAKNFILVLIDTLRADRLSAYNNETRVRTACLDELADQSMIFERALAPENWTKPSVASLLSGLYSESHKTQDDKAKLPDSVVLASEHFKELGFITSAFVANGYISSKFGFRQGWDAWINYVREHKANRAQFVIDDAIAWIESRQDDKPFFLYLHTIDPHVPYIPPKKYWSIYDSGPYNGPVQPTETAKLLEKVKTGRMKLGDRDKLRLEALYDGEVTYHDDQFARLLKELEKHGLLEDTLLIVTADHGEEFFEHGLVGHGHSLYEELLHVPLLIRLPGALKGAGARSSAEVSLVDVLPTACDILGVEHPTGLEGRSLVPLLAGEYSFSYASASFSDFLNGQRAARMGRYKIIYKGLGPMLFDLKTDPKETLDLVSERPAALAAMRDILGEHLGRLIEAPGDAGGIGRARHKGEKVKIDPETERQLKALGYLGGD
jgi:choline-sulfatase